MAIDKELEQRIFSYYQAERDRDWNKAYSYRTPGYRESILKNNYIDGMEKYNKEWSLLDFKILDVNEINGKVVFRIVFKEKAPISSLSGNYSTDELTNTIELETEDVSIWVKINGIWYCYAASSRNHNPLNEALVYEK